jgi:hypothetical protein
MGLNEKFFTSMVTAPEAVTGADPPIDMDIDADGPAGAALEPPPPEALALLEPQPVATRRRVKTAAEPATAPRVLCWDRTFMVTAAFSSFRGQVVRRSVRWA